MGIKKLKQEIINNVIWNVVDETKHTGQTCGMPKLTQKLISEDIGIKIEISCNRSAFKNRELAMVLFELALDELIK